MPDTLKEYLIALGFKVDENGWKSFNAKLAQSSKNVAELGAATVGAAAEIGVAVEKVSKQYESLYYVSQRSGSAVGNLKAFEFSMKQIGLSAEDGRSAIEGFAAAMRGSPGVKSMFARMGVDTNDAEKGVGQLVDRLKTMPFFLAKAYGAMAGLDEHTLVQLIANRGKQIEQEKVHKQLLKDAGIDADEYARKSVDFNRKLNDTEARWGALADRVAISWLPVATRVVDVAGNIADAFIRADRSTNGWAGQIVSLTLALGGTYKALGLIARMLGVGGAAGASLGIGRAAMARLGPVGAVLATMWPTDLNAKESMPHGGPSTNDTSDRANAWRASQGSRAGGREAALAFYQSKGWSREQAAGIVSNLESESKMNPRASGDGGSAYGLGQWHPDRQANFARWAGKDIRDSTLQEQMEFVHYELTQGKEKLAGNALRGSKTASDAGSIMSRMYERPADVFGEAGKRGELADTILSSPQSGANLSVSHKTENHITGVSDPAKAASLIDESQRRVNGDIVRNTKSLFE